MSKKKKPFTGKYDIPSNIAKTFDDINVKRAEYNRKEKLRNHDLTIQRLMLNMGPIKPLTYQDLIDTKKKLDNDNLVTNGKVDTDIGSWTKPLTVDTTTGPSPIDPSTPNPKPIVDVVALENKVKILSDDFTKFTKIIDSYKQQWSDKLVLDILIKKLGAVEERLKELEESMRIRRE